MKPGDIVRNWSASASNPRRCFVVTDVGRLDVSGFDREFREVCFEHKNSDLEVIGSIDLSPLDRALEEHATKECGTRESKP